MSETDDGPASLREKAGCVVGISSGLFLILALVGSLFSVRGAVLEPGPVLRERFSFEALPFDLELVSAAVLPGGDRVVRLAHPDYREPEPTAPPVVPPEADAEDAAKTDEAAPASDGGPAAGGSPVWTPPEIDYVEGSPPTEVFFVLTRSPASAVRTFDGASGGGSGMGGPGGGGMDGGMPGGSGAPIPIDGGDLDWGRSRVGYRHERRFENGGAFDEVRVNLSETGRYCVMIARWPKDHAGSVERVEELLESFTRADA